MGEFQKRLRGLAVAYNVGPDQQRQYNEMVKIVEEVKKEFPDLLHYEELDDLTCIVHDWFEKWFGE